MSLQESARRAWVTIGVPGTDHPRYSTYVRYDANALPKCPLDLQHGDGLDWLRDLPEIGQGMLPDEYGYITTPLTAPGVERLMEAAGLTTPFASLPEDLCSFVTETALHRRLFSATDAYLDAGERLTRVPGGHLLHLVSDSQWVSHWLAFIGTDGSTGVVCTPAGLGYDDAEEDADEDGEKGDPLELTWVADSVAEFVWRWWADNYAFAHAQPSYTPPLKAPAWFDLTSYIAGYTGPADSDKRSTSTRRDKAASHAWRPPRRKGERGCEWATLMRPSTRPMSGGRRRAISSPLPARGAVAASAGPTRRRRKRRST